MTGTVLLVGGLVWLALWLLAAHLLWHERQRLGPGTARRRQLEAAGRLLHALELLCGELLPGPHAANRAVLERERLRIGLATEALERRWSRWSYLRPLNTLWRLSEAGLRGQDDPPGWPLLAVVEALDQESIRRVGYLDRDTLEDHDRGPRELRRRVALVTTLTETMADDWREMRGDPEVSGLVPAQGPTGH
ncbi:MAG: hypothetical protein EOO72_15360, partial [Myxococcaceae bacterium]